MNEENFINVDDLHLPGLEINELESGQTEQKTYSLAELRSEVEKRAIKHALRQCEGNISKAAKLLDVTRPTLYSLIERLDISRQNCLM